MCDGGAGDQLSARNQEPGAGRVMMSPERWRQIERVWDQALELSDDEREAFLNSACADDDELRDELSSLLVAYDGCANFLEEPAIKSVAAVLLARKHQPDGGQGG